MKFLKTKFKLTFFIISLIINISFGVITAEANNYHNHNHNHNHLNAKKSKVYLGYGYISDDNPYHSAIYSKCGIEVFFGDRYKVTLEHGSAPVYLTSNKDGSDDYLDLGLEYHNQNFIAEIKAKQYHDVSSKGIDLPKDSKIVQYTQYKVGMKYNIDNSLYLIPKTVLVAKTTIVDFDFTNANHKFCIAPEITIGTNFEIPNTIINLNPEVYLNHRFDLSNSNKNTSVIGTNINFDINMFFVKLEHQANLLDKYSNLINNTSFTFGVKF